MRFGFRYKPKDRLANAIAACNCHVKASAACIGGDRVHVHRHNMGCRGWHCTGHRREYFLVQYELTNTGHLAGLFDRTGWSGLDGTQRVQR